MESVPQDLVPDICIFLRYRDIVALNTVSRDLFVRTHALAQRVKAENTQLVPYTGTDLYVPLEFWFCRNTGLAIPLFWISVPDDTYELHLRDLDEIVYRQESLMMP